MFTKEEAFSSLSFFVLGVSKRNGEVGDLGSIVLRPPRLSRGRRRPRPNAAEKGLLAFPSPLLAGQPAAAKGERESAREPFLLKCLTPKEKSQTDRQDLFFFFPSQPPSARNTRQTGYNWIGPTEKKPKQI